MIGSILAVVCGGAVGFALALTGGGGSTLAIPLLLYGVGLHDMHLAIGTSAVAVAVALNAYVNLIPHARAGHVHWRAAVWPAHWPAPMSANACMAITWPHCVRG